MKLKRTLTVFAAGSTIALASTIGGATTGTPAHPYIVDFH